MVLFEKFHTTHLELLLGCYESRYVDLTVAFGGPKLVEQQIADPLYLHLLLLPQIRFLLTSDQSESYFHLRTLPLLPELLDLQTDVKHILNIPICMERMKNALSMYTDIDIDELQDLMTKLAEGNLNNAIQTARSWFEDSAIKPSE